MKIGYFTAAFPYRNPLTGKMIKPYNGGGVENVVYNLAVQMAKRGHDVFIFTSAIDSNSSIENYNNIKIYRYAKSFNIGSSPISLSSLYKPLFLASPLDIVHVHLGNLPLPLIGSFYSKINNKPLITTYHADYMGGFGSLVRRFGVYLFDNFIADILLKSSDIILTPSEYYINESKQLSNIRNSVVPIPNGINLKDFDLNISKSEARTKLNLLNDKQIILFVGSLTPRKGPDILLKAMVDVHQKISDAYLVFIGDGMMKKDLEDLARRLNIDQNVRFTGFISDDLKLLYYKASDLFVLPSLLESFGIVLLEASAVGLPLVVSNLEAFNTIVKDGYNGFFTKKGDQKDLGEKIVYILQNKDLRIKMSKNAKENSNNYSWTRVADETEKIYLNLIV